MEKIVKIAFVLRSWSQKLYMRAKIRGVALGMCIICSFFAGEGGYTYDLFNVSLAACNLEMIILPI